MIEEKEIDLLAIAIWKLKAIYKNYILVLACLILGVGIGFYRYKTTPPVTQIEKTFILRSNLPHAGALFKLSQSILQESKTSLKSALNLSDTILNQLTVITLDTTYKPNLLLKISGNNEVVIDNFKNAFFSFYNNLIKDDLRFEIERCERIIKKFNLKLNGNLLETNTLNINLNLQPLEDREKLDFYDRGLEYIKRKEAIERNGGFTVLDSYTQVTLLGGANLTKNLVLYSIIGILTGVILAILKEGWKIVKPLLKD